MLTSTGPLPATRLAEIRARSVTVRAALGPGSQPSPDEPTSLALMTNVVRLLRDDLPVLLFEIERLQAELQFAADLLNLEDA